MALQFYTVTTLYTGMHKKSADKYCRTAKGLSTQRRLRMYLVLHLSAVPVNRKEQHPMFIKIYFTKSLNVWANGVDHSVIWDIVSQNCKLTLRKK